MDEVIKMLQGVTARLGALEQKWEQPSGPSNDRETGRSNPKPDGTNGNAEEPAPASALLTLGETASGSTAEPKPPAVNKKTGKLDALTLMRFPAYGSDNLAYAEKWIAKTEELAAKLNLDKEQMCLAVRQRAVGEVKKCLEGYEDDDTKDDWASLCEILLCHFGKQKLTIKFWDELSSMDKIGGLPLLMALQRVKRLLDLTDHPPSDIVPMLKLVNQFPEKLATRLNGRQSKWKTCQEALGDLKEIAKEMERISEPALIARASPKAGLVAVAEPVDVAEPADPVVPVAAVMRRKEGSEALRCYYCDKTGHVMKKCPVLAEKIAKSKQSKN
jgi:hypothetical protein